MSRVNFSILIISIISFILLPFVLIQTLSIFVILSFLLSYIYSRILYSHLKIYMDKEIYYCKNGEEEYATFKVANRSILPNYNILIQIRGNGCFENSEGLFLSTLQAKEIKSFKSKIITNVRGSHTIGPIIIKGSDPFNFFPWSLVIDNFSEVVIYPRYHDINLLLTNGERGGHQIVKNPMYEDLSNLKSIREFRSGDSLKRVNWKATAKVGSLQTMEYSNSLSTPLFIIMDLDPSKYPIKHRYTYLERAIEVTASLITSYSQKNESCGLITKDKLGTILIPQGRGYINTVSILDRLAKLNFSTLVSESIIKSFFNSKVVLPTGAHLYILLPNIDNEVLMDMNLFKRGRYNIKLVNTGGGVIEHTPNNLEVLTLTSYGKEFFI